MKRMTKRELELGRILYPDVDVVRPVTRADCEGGARPCAFVSCKHHLYLDVTRKGSVKVNFPDVDVEALEALPATCALDVAARGGQTLEEVGAIMNLTRERVRQIEVRAFEKLASPLVAILSDAKDDALDRGLPRLHQQAARDQGEASIDVREAWTVVDEFLLPELVEEGARRK